MSAIHVRVSVLARHYQQYLRDEHAATFIKAVAQRFTLGTLHRLCSHGTRVTRRAAALAVGFLGGYESNHALGRSLHDVDRGVRLLAESGIRACWLRAGNEQHTRQLADLARLNTARQFAEAVDKATQLIDEAPGLAEAWNQRAIAHFHLGRHSDSADDCHQTLELNPYHFPAAVGMGNCYLELNDAEAALECFRRALRLNPDLEGVRAQVDYLERLLEEQP